MLTEFESENMKRPVGKPRHGWEVNMSEDHNSLTLRRLMSYIYGAPIFYVSRSHTTQHSR
jgi:hypothetical protein